MSWFTKEKFYSDNESDTTTLFLWTVIHYIFLVFKQRRFKSPTFRVLVPRPSKTQITSGQDRYHTKVPS